MKNTLLEFVRKYTKLNIELEQFIEQTIEKTGVKMEESYPGGAELAFQGSLEDLKSILEEMQERTTELIDVYTNHERILFYEQAKLN